MEKKWYIVRTQTNREKSVSEKLISAMESGDLQRKVLQVLAPTKTSFYVKDSKKVKKELAMFPGYIFVEVVDDLSVLKDYLRTIKGNSGFLTDRHGKPEPLSEKEIHRMLGMQEVAKKEQKENPFIIDEEVLVIAGPFNTMRGTIEKVDGENVKVAISIFGRKTPVELKIDQISKDY